MKVIDRRNQLQPSDYFETQPDVWPLTKEYFELSLATGNHISNTKYCLLYILKTHKVYYEQFKKIQLAKGAEVMAEILEVELTGLKESQKMHLDGSYYKKFK